MRRAALALVAACGNDHRAPDAGDDATAHACAAVLTGNFAESSTDPANCPTLAGGTLAFSIPVHTLATTLDVAIDLGATPTPGAYSSDAAMTWSARAAQLIGNGICLYSAGSKVVPHGDFTLALDSVDPPRGTLALTQYVLVYPDTNCGDGDTEQVRLTF